MTSLKEIGQKLRDIFSKKAAKPEDRFFDTLARDPRMKKAVKRNKPFYKAKRMLRNTLIGIFTTAATASIVTVEKPDLVSTPYDTYMSAHGYPNNLSRHFDSQNVRVYDHNKYLQPFHFAGVAAKEEIKNAADGGVISLAAHMMTTVPLHYISNFFQSRNTLENKLDEMAFTFRFDDLYQDPNLGSFIMPPSDKANVAGIFSGALGIEAPLHFKNDVKELDKAFFEYIMLHERRHTDQSLYFGYRSMNETDADDYALRVMETRGTKPEIISELTDLIKTFRSLNAVLGGDIQHVTTHLDQNSRRTVLGGFEDNVGYLELCTLMADIQSKNFMTLVNLDGPSQAYYTALSMMLDPALMSSNRPLLVATASFLDACQKMDALTGGHFIDKHNQVLVNTAVLYRPYKPTMDVNIPKPPAERINPDTSTVIPPKFQF